MTEETPDLFADDATAAPPNASAEDFAEGFAADHFGARLAAFGRWRAADPAAARAALEEVWKGETAFRRAALLEAMAVGLSPGDEPFLAAARDDRSKAVPAAAEELLLRLTDSAHARTTRAAADRLLDFADGRLSVTLPPAKGTRLAGDDGIDWGLLAATGTAGGRGPRAGRLVRAVASVPPSHWCERFSATPAALVAAADAAEHGGDVLAGWLAAGARFAATDPAVPADWAPALSAWTAVRLDRPRGEGKNEPAPDGDVSAFVAALPPAGAAAFIAPLLRTAAVARDPAGVGAPLWSAAPDPWPDDFGRAVAAAVDAAGDRGFEYHVWHAALPEVLTRLPPAVLDDLPPDWPTPGGAPRWLERAAASARLRRRLHELLP